MKVSIVLATYNGEKYISEQLRSIYNQSRQADEVIIADDCSQDNTFTIISEFIERNKLQSWRLSKNDTNLGYSANFSNLLFKANGDIIFLADQDDIWNYDKVEKMCSVMQRNPNCQMLVSNVKPLYMGENSKKVNYQNFGKKEIIKITNKYQWIKPARPGCSMCIRSEILKSYQKLWFNTYPHDCLLWGMAVLNGAAYIYNRNTMRFRRHDSNASSRGGGDIGFRIKNIDNELMIFEKVLQNGDLNNNLKLMLEKQKKVYVSRKKYLSEKNLFGVLSLAPKLHLYSRPRLWLTDIYYCIK